MRTPAGAECVFYYEDRHRGRDQVECRIERAADSAEWRAADCASCPVPRILLHNSSPHLSLALSVRKGALGIGRRTVLRARCLRHGVEIPEPEVGCPKCANEEIEQLLSGDG